MSLFMATWAIGQNAPERAIPKSEIGKATTVTDLSDFKTEPIVKNSSTRSALNEGFEGTEFPPPGWKVINGGSSDQTWVRYTDNPITGTASASIRYHAQAHDDWLITPPLLPVAGNNTITFKAKQGSNNYTDKFNVKLSTTGNDSADFTITLASDIGPASTTVETFTYDLSAYNGDTVYFAVQAISKNELRLYVDDFVGPEIYVSPTDLVVTSGNKDYRLIPKSQLNNALTLKTIVYNAGAPLTEAIIINTTIKDEGNTTILSSAGLLNSLGTYQTDIVTSAPIDATSLTVGNYYYSHIAIFSADHNIADNTDIFNFSVTNDIYARDAGEFANEGYGTSGKITFGNLFNILNQTQISGVQFVWPTTLPTTTAKYRLALYKLDNETDMNVDGAPIFTTDEYVRDQSQAGQTMTIVVPPKTLQPGLYVLAIKQTTYTNIRIAYDGTSHGFMLRANSADNPTKFSRLEGYGFASLRMDLTPRMSNNIEMWDNVTSDPIEGGVVTIKQGDSVITTAITDNLGEADFFVPNGNYTYTAEKFGYVTQENIPFTVSGDTEVGIGMDQVPTTLEVTPNTFTFPATQIGTSTATQTFTLRNIGHDTLVIEPAGILFMPGGPDNNQFTLTNIGAQVKLALGETATIGVTFNPTTLGEKAASLIVSPTGGVDAKTIALNGNAVDNTIT